MKQRKICTYRWKRPIMQIVKMINSWNLCRSSICRPASISGSVMLNMGHKSAKQSQTLHACITT